MGVKNKCFCKGAFLVVNGLTTRFCENTWRRDEPLLCHTRERKDVSIATVMGQVQLNIEFLKTLIGGKWKD